MKRQHEILSDAVGYKICQKREDAKTNARASKMVEAMDVYAKETAIDFAKWLLKNYWQMGDDSYASTEGGEKRWNTKELYELYLKTDA